VAGPVDSKQAVAGTVDSKQRETRMSRAAFLRGAAMSSVVVIMPACQSLTSATVRGIEDEIPGIKDKTKEVLDRTATNLERLEVTQRELVDLKKQLEDVIRDNRQNVASITSSTARTMRNVERITGSLADFVEYLKGLLNANPSNAVRIAQYLWTKFIERLSRAMTELLMMALLILLLRFLHNLRERLFQEFPWLRWIWMLR
jgi:septal ring factor EnvC (AmiA/AmiB activator)